MLALESSAAPVPRAPRRAPRSRKRAVGAVRRRRARGSQPPAACTPRQGGDPLQHTLVERDLRRVLEVAAVLRNVGLRQPEARRSARSRVEARDPRAAAARASARGGPRRPAARAASANSTTTRASAALPPRPPDEPRALSLKARGELRALAACRAGAMPKSSPVAERGRKREEQHRARSRPTSTEPREVVAGERRTQQLDAPGCARARPESATGQRQHQALGQELSRPGARGRRRAPAGSRSRGGGPRPGRAGGWRRWRRRSAGRTPPPRAARAGPAGRCRRGPPAAGRTRGVHPSVDG